MGASVTIFQWSALIFGVLYLILAGKNKNSCWVFSILSTLSIAIEDFLYLHLYFNGIVQIFYSIISICGLYIWYNGSNNKTKLRISRLSITNNIGYLLVALVISLPISYLMSINSNASFPFLDGFTCILSIIATFFMVYKIIDTWFYWTLINLICVYLFYSSGAPLISVLFLIYLILAIHGWKKWYDLYKNFQRYP